MFNTFRDYARRQGVHVEDVDGSGDLRPGNIHYVAYCRESQRFYISQSENQLPENAIRLAWYSYVPRGYYMLLRAIGKRTLIPDDVRLMARFCAAAQDYWRVEEFITADVIAPLIDEDWGAYYVMTDGRLVYLDKLQVRLSVNGCVGVLSQDVGDPNKCYVALLEFGEFTDKYVKRISPTQSNLSGTIFNRTSRLPQKMAGPFVFGRVWPKRGRVMSITDGKELLVYGLTYEERLLCTHRGESLGIALQAVDENGIPIPDYVTVIRAVEGRPHVEECIRIEDLIGRSPVYEAFRLH